MKKKCFISLLILLGSYLSFAQITTAPSPVLADQSAVITFNKTGTPLAAYTGIIYAYVGVTVNGVQWQNIKGSPVWGNNVQPAMTPVTANTYSLTISPDLFTYFGVSTANSITQICIIFRSADATMQTADAFIPVGAFQYTLTAPALNSYNFLTSGSNFTVSSTNTNGSATYNLIANGTTINTQTTANYSYTHTNITTNQVYSLQITQGITTFTAKFTVIINPGSTTQTLPVGMVDGVNYNPTDPTKATIVLNAPFKDFVYLAGSFNNWQPTSTYAMRKDGTRFWLELTGLTPGQVYTYQYWVCDQTARPANSPALVKTADPFSNLVLSPFDDPEIATLGVYPGLPTYPVGQEREVSVFQTGPTAFWNYTWSSASTNFVKPKKKDLVIYEALVRDFDANRTYQDLINKITYFKDLKINAIQLMPVMEFEGNMSWGYNTVYHLAPDKRYGPPAKLKEFVDLCHQNGIAVILDIALNHVFGRSPLERMWMLDTDNDGWANGTGFRTSTENPYINQSATHAYSVGSDINHFLTTGPGNNLTKTYVTRTIKTWIEDYKIDGFRWDLTKGFTNQCTSGDEGCTNGYRTDRVAKLKEYADIQWSLDPNFLVIFEHLGTGGSASEELEWADYLRSGDAKGIMQWRKVTDPYANLVKGNYADISGVTEKGTTSGLGNMKYRFIGYAESHDEERIVYKALNEAGQTQGNLLKAHQRLSAMGALHLLVPGPKMIWHFGELGWEKSLWTCNNNVVSFSNPDCKLDTKPQPQWVGNWVTDVNRIAIYNNWSKFNALKQAEDVFENGDFAWNLGQTGSPRLDIWTSISSSATLSYVFVRTNFSDAVLNTGAGFPYTGAWYNMMDNSTINVTDTNMNIAIEAGGFRVYGNQPTALNTNQFSAMDFVAISPNPAINSFTINVDTAKVEVYSVTGQLVKSFQDSNINNQYDISELNQGVYLVKITDNNNNEKTTRLIKQ